MDCDNNPYDKITVALPGAKDMNTEDVFWEWTSTKAWRRFMKYPPKQSDLWRLANKLQLYGEEWDEEEQKAISGSNAALSGLPFSTDMVSAEEQLMLMGRASTEEEAQVMIYGAARDTTKVAQLYTAPDPEDDERAAKAMEEMADAMLQLQESVAAGHRDPSVLKTINETNMDTLCPFTKPGAFFGDEKDRECEGGGFDWDKGVSPTNENNTIQALRDTLTTLMKEYSTTVEQDDVIISDSLLSPIRHSAVVLRRREKQLLLGTIEWLDDRRSKLLNLTIEGTQNETFYQIEAVKLKEIVRKQKLKDRKEWRLKIQKELMKSNEVA